MSSGVWIQIAQLILSLSILVILHELGHFLPAKWFKTRVEKFYLFFNPYFSLIKKKIGDTEYGIGWLPLGGYVKIAGMIDESMDKKQMNKNPEPWEFRAKPAWQRLIIMGGGVTVNVILGYLIFSMLLFTWGQSFIYTQDLKYGIVTDSIGKAIGFKNGDHLLKIDGKTTTAFNTARKDLLFSDQATVLRDGKKVTLNFSDEDKAKMLAHNGLIDIRMPARVGYIQDSLDVGNAGVLPGDKILKINNTPVYYFDEVSSIIRKNPSQSISLLIERKGKKQQINVKVNKQGLIGISSMIVAPDLLKKEFNIIDKKYSFFEALTKGGRYAYEVLKDNVCIIYMIIFKPKTEAYKQAGSFISITKAFSSYWDWQSFWFMTGQLSLVLAIMNLLPIPALDGGHMVFTLWEIITRRKPRQKFLEAAQIIGGIIILTLIVVVISWDVIKNFFL